MAYRVLNRFIPSRFALFPRINRPILSSSIASHCRSFSEDASASAKPLGTENPQVKNNASRASFKSSLSQPELLKFAAIADTWWDAEGPFKPLHALNPARLAFIRLTLCDHFGKDPNSTRPFEGLKFIDVGCGGGILSEPLARMGASVTGIDAVEKNIKIATVHAELDPVTSAIEYQCTTAEKLVTPEWSKFLTPEELVLILNRASISVKEMAGFVFNPLTGRWSVSDDIGVNFIAYGTKNA